MLAWTTAALTLVLIIITGFYAWANWKTMRFMEADVRSRLQPIIHFGIGSESKLESGLVRFGAIIEVEHAPARLVNFETEFVLPNGEKKRRVVDLQNHFISNDSRYPYANYFDCEALGDIKDWHVVFRYRDLSSFLEYTSYFNRDGTTRNAPVGSHPKSFWRRLGGLVLRLDRLANPGD